MDMESGQVMAGQEQSMEDYREMLREAALKALHENGPEVILALAGEVADMQERLGIVTRFAHHHQHVPSGEAVECHHGALLARVGTVSSGDPSRGAMLIAKLAQLGDQQVMSADASQKRAV